MAIDEKLEAEFNAKIREVAYETILDLRSTLKPHFRPKDLGYLSVEHARFVMIDQVDKKINKLSSEHLKKVGKL